LGAANCGGIVTILSFIVALGLLVFIHEFGHYFGLSEDEIESGERSTST